MEEAELDPLVAAIMAEVPECAVILHGSLAAGGYRPGRSDIDLLVVPAGPLADRQLDGLESVVRRAHADLDLHVVTAAVAAAPPRLPPVELYAGRHGSLVESERRLPGDPDVLAELSMARASGRTLIGPSPRSVIGEVPPEWIRARGRHWLQTWQTRTDDTEHAVFMTLTACRIWLFARETRHAPKRVAARWALGRDPSAAAIRAALADTPPAPGELAALLAAILDDRPLL